MRHSSLRASRWPYILAVVLALAAARFATAANWPGWRGPSGVGISEEVDLPLAWNGQKGENVLWKAPLSPAVGHSSPIVWGDRVFLTTSERPKQDREIPAHYVWAFQAADGKLLWKTEIRPGTAVVNHETYAAPTPVTDGTAVYCWFGSAVVAAVNFDGKQLWRHERTGPFDVNPGICSSPVLFQDTVLLLCDQGGGKGWLQALDKSTGEIRWEQKRDKLSHTNASLVLISVDRKPQLIVQASNQLQGLSPATGEPLWWCEAAGFGSSPAFGSGLVYSDAGNGESGLAVDPKGSGDVSASLVKWRIDKVPAQYQSAVVAGGFVFRAGNSDIIRCVDLLSGEERFKSRAQGVPTVCSPFATADGRVYFASAERSYVIAATPKLEVLSVNDLGGGGNSSSAAVSNGRIYIRGDQTLFCIGKK